MIKFFVINFESLVKFFSLVFYQQRLLGYSCNVEYDCIYSLITRTTVARLRMRSNSEHQNMPKHPVTC